MILGDSPVRTFVKPPSSALRSGARLPEVDVLTFDGDPLNWSVFWDQFETFLAKDPHLADLDKIFYLGTAIKSRRSCRQRHYYLDIVDSLKQRYYRRRAIYKNYLR